MIALKFLCVGDKLMMEMHLRQPGFMYSACGPFTKYEKIKKLYPSERTRQGLFLMQYSLWCL